MIKKGEKKKVITILLLLIVVLGMAIGYAALSQTLNITGTAHIASDWNIKIINATRSSGSGATDKPSSPSFTATTATFDVELANPGATATYTITIKNEGMIPARLNSVNGVTEANATNPTEIQFATNANVSDVLLAGETVNYTVTVTWDSESEEIPQVKTKTATITFEYVQNT